MMRTRRKDCNVKPNRRDSRLSRLDRKSSRGMLYENEELRLKTININAEVESRESDIKKLRRENEMLKKGIWYIRDEYDKLERLIKEKKIDFSSSSTTCTTSSSDTESCSSCSDESEEVETTQNLRNVQRTNMRNFQEQFDHLSVVTEENSVDNNSEMSSHRNSLPPDVWKTTSNNNIREEEEDIIPPDQSYPSAYGSIRTKSQTLPMTDHFQTTNYFAPIKTSKSLDDNHFNQMQMDTLYPGEFYEDKFLNIHPNATGFVNGTFQHEPGCELYKSQKIYRTDATNIYQNIVLVPKMHEQTDKVVEQVLPLSKSATDLIVKIDNQNFNSGIVFSNTPPSQSTFSNGGNLEELLNDIESISQRGGGGTGLLPDGDNHQRFPIKTEGALNNDLRGDIDYKFAASSNRHPRSAAHVVKDNWRQSPEQKEETEQEEEKEDKPFKSELNVVLMPNPMPLIGVDKYKEIKRSIESINSKPIEELSASHQNLCIIPPPPPPPLEAWRISPLPPPAINQSLENIMTTIPKEPPETNPFFFGNFKDNYVNSDYFSLRYNPDNFPIVKDNNNKEPVKTDVKSSSKANLLDLTSSDHLSSENEDKFKIDDQQLNNINVQQQNLEQNKISKPPKMTLRKKVSIRFGAKKDKKKSIINSEPSTPATPDDRKKSLFDKKDKDKLKINHQQTSSMEYKKSTSDTNNQEPKTPTSSDSKTSSSEKKTSGEKKTRNSVSLSPERTKHVQLKEEGAGRKHKKHKKSDRNRLRRGSVLIDQRGLRERSFSVCTDRSNTMEHRLGLGLGFGSSFMFEEYSDGGRTNSLSSCDINEHGRKMSTMSNIPMNGKVPWCGCWGNGCL